MHARPLRRWWLQPSASLPPEQAEHSFCRSLASSTNHPSIHPPERSLTRQRLEIPDRFLDRPRHKRDSHPVRAEDRLGGAGSARIRSDFARSAGSSAPDLIARGSRRLQVVRLGAGGACLCRAGRVRAVLCSVRLAKFALTSRSSTSRGGANDGHDVVGTLGLLHGFKPHRQALAVGCIG